MKTLADLRKEKDAPASLPTRIVPVCLDQALLADVQRLTAEKSDLLMAAAVAPVDEDGDRQGPPRRQVPVRNPRIAEIDTELEPLYERLRESEGELLLRAVDGGRWLRWKDEHPAREKNDADERLAYGFCNASDLAADLGKYVVSWNGDDLGPGEWDDWLAAKVAPADIAACISAVVGLQESRVQAPKLLNSSSEPPTSVTDSPSPAA